VNEETLLYRQVHPNFVQFDGISTQAFSAPASVTSQTFTPTDKDDNKLSVYDGDVFTPEQSYEHYTQKLSSYGVLGLTVTQFDSQGLTAAADDETFEGHVLIDYSSCKTKGELIKKAKKLRDMAMQRNWLYRKPDEKEAGAS